VQTQPGCSDGFADIRAGSNDNLVALRGERAEQRQQRIQVSRRTDADS
jgi:hypothetical protein